jgi:hypothetical protein
MPPCLFDCLSPVTGTERFRTKCIEFWTTLHTAPHDPDRFIRGGPGYVIFAFPTFLCSQRTPRRGCASHTRTISPSPLHTLQLLPFLSTPVPATPTARHRRCACRKLRAVGSTQADRSGAPERWIRTYREEQAMPDTPLHWRTALAPSRRSEQPARRKQMNNAFPS